MLRPSRAVVVVAFPVEWRRALREAGGAVGHHWHQSHGLAAGLARPRLAGVLQAFHALLEGDRAHAFAARCADVEGTDGGDRLHAQLGRSVAQGIAAAGADAKRADPLGIDLRMPDEEVDGAADVVQTLRRNLHQPRLAAALPLVGGVVGERQEALLSQVQGVEAGRLLLHAAERVSHDDRRVLAARVESGRLEEIGNDRGADVPRRVGDSLDRHPFLVGVSDHRRLLDRGGLSRRRSRPGHR